jgi:serine protease
MFNTRLRATVLFSTVLVLVAGGPSRPAAQQGGWVSPYQLLTSPERALALVKAANDRLPFIPGEVLVKFREGVTAVEQQSALSALRSRPSTSALEWLGPVALLRDPTEANAALLAERLSRQPEVEYAEPNFLYRRNATPNDPSFSAHQWNLTAIGIDKAWDINPCAQGDVVVAVIDYGITTVNQSFTFPTWDGTATRNIAVPFRTNPDLSDARLLAGRDFAFWGGPVLDMDGHGTHVSSTVAEDTNNALAGAGIAYNATIMPLKACMGYWDVQFTLSAQGYRGFVPQDVGGCTDSAIAQAIRFAVDNGAAVINISLGGPGASATLRDALVYAAQHGAFVAIAMGNEYEEGNPTDYPAADAATIDGVMSVAAVGRSLKRAYYSNTGAHTEIAAPGGDVTDGGVGGLIWQPSMDPDDFDSSTVLFPRFDRYVELPEQGTSMASPHVAGIAALIWSQGVRNPAAIEKLIEATALDLGNIGRDPQYGFGLIQPRAALRGFGVAR